MSGNTKDILVGIGFLVVLLLILGASLYHLFAGRHALAGAIGILGLIVCPFALRFGFIVLRGLK